MPNDCWNHITITCDCIKELDNLVNNELKQQFADNPALLPQLKRLGVVSEKSTEYKAVSYTHLTLPTKRIV